MYEHCAHTLYLSCTIRIHVSSFELIQSDAESLYDECGLVP